MTSTEMSITQHFYWKNLRNDVERLYKKCHRCTIGNISRSHQVLDIELDENDPWSGILPASVYTTRATIHATLKATPT
jgi:hypothetical protein